MENDIAGNQHAEHDEDTEIAPIVAGNDFAQRDCREYHEERHVDCGRDPLTPNGRAGNGHAAGQPQREEPGQRIAIDRQPAGPVGNCGEQKTRNGRRDIAVDHLVDVPIDRIKGSRQRQLAEILRQPKCNAQCGPRRSAQKKGSETVRENRRTGIFKATLKCGRRVHREPLDHDPIRLNRVMVWLVCWSHDLVKTGDRFSGHSLSG